LPKNIVLKEIITNRPSTYSEQLNRLGLGWVSTFMDCMFDTNNKKG